MKRSSIGILVILWAPVCGYAQGNFGFNNYATSVGLAPVTISTAPGSFNPTDGPAGAYVGSDYTASLYYLNGIVTGQALFDSGNPIFFPTADTPFWGITGLPPAHQPTSDGAGIFDGGDQYLFRASGLDVTVQVRAWYNGGGLYTSYDQALAAGQNVGESIPVPVGLALVAEPETYMDGLLPFTVGIAPEPSTFALLGLGGLVLPQFARQRK